MNILYISTSFPKETQGSTIYTDLAEALYYSGHNLTVVVSDQNHSKKNTKIKKERGFKVLRLNTGNYYDVSFIEKGITTLITPCLMKKGIKCFLSDESFDLILYEAPPVTNAKLVTWAKKRFNCKSYLMLKDIFPQNAVDIGILNKNSFFYKYFKYQEKVLYESADIIGCMSEANIKYIRDNNAGIPENRIQLFPNTKFLTKDIRCEENIMRKKFNIPQEACVFMFGGNMGKPQYVELLCETILELKNNNNLFFLFIGRGTERYKIDNTIKNNFISNSKIIENLPRNEYNEILKEIDVGLIVLDHRFTIPNYPSRILSYLEYGKPILAATDKITDIQKLLYDAKCGEWVWSGDTKAFISAVKKMSKNQDLLKMGLSGRKYIENNLNIDTSVSILEKFNLNEI